MAHGCNVFFKVTKSKNFIKIPILQTIFIKFIVTKLHLILNMNINFKHYLFFDVNQIFLNSEHNEECIGFTTVFF